MRLRLLNGNFLDGSGTAPAELQLADTTNRVIVTGSGSRLVCPASIGGSNPLGTIIGYCFGRNSIEFSNAAELVAPYRFGLGYSANANCNTAVFSDHAVFSTTDIYVGRNGSCGNSLAILSSATGVCGTGYVGGDGSSCGNTMIVSNASFKCRRSIVSNGAGGTSNALWIAGSGTLYDDVTTFPGIPSLAAAGTTAYLTEGDMELLAPHGDRQRWSSNTVTFCEWRDDDLGGGLYFGTHETRVAETEWKSSMARHSMPRSTTSAQGQHRPVSNATLMPAATW